MEAVEEHSDRKVEREQMIASLEAEKASLQSEIAAMKERLAQLEFERSVRTLQGEIEALRTEKDTLEARANAYQAEAQDVGRINPSPTAIRAGPGILGNTAQVPMGQGKVEQVRPLREAVPDRNPSQQRASPAPGMQRTPVPVQTLGTKPKSNQ